MSFIDPFSEGIFSGKAEARLTEASGPLAAAVVSNSVSAEWGEYSYDIFHLVPGGVGTPPGLRFQGQVSSDLSTWVNVEGLVFDWLPSAGDGFGSWGVRISNARLPIVRKSGVVSANNDRRQVRRWIATEVEADASTWTLDRFWCTWVFHKGSAPEDHAAFNFQPGKESRLKLDFS